MANEKLDLLNWDNERLGELFKKSIKHLSEKKIDGYESIGVMSALFLLVSQVEESNAATFTMELSDVSSEIHPNPTNWRVTVEKLS